MLSLTRGDPICTVTPKNGKEFTVYIYGAQNFGRNEPPHLKVDDELSLLDAVFFKTHGVKDKAKLLQQLKDNVDNDDTQAAKEYIQDSLRKRITFPIEDEVYPIPQAYSERAYISAPSGAGKSYFTGQYVERIREKFGKKRPLYIFSRVDEDEALDKIKPKKLTTRVPLEEELWNTVQINPEDFEEGSIIVFDDIDTIQNKALRNKVQALRSNILETGRHNKLTVIATSHQIQNFMETRQLINEAAVVVLFPRASSKYHISSFLEKYMGLNSLQIKEIYALPTRWIYVHKQYPRYVISQHSIFLL